MSTEASSSSGAKPAASEPKEEADYEYEARVDDEATLAEEEAMPQGDAKVMLYYDDQDQLEDVTLDGTKKSARSPRTPLHHQLSVHTFQDRW